MRSAIAELRATNSSLKTFETVKQWNTKYSQDIFPEQRNDYIESKIFFKGLNRLNYYLLGMSM